MADNITHSLNKSDIVISIFLDLNKYFKRSTIQHCYGNYMRIIYEEIHLRGYIIIISQYIVFGSKPSETQTVKCGIPQGSILRPPLFIIYMNDI